MFSRVLIANRGAIACRILRTLHKLGIESIAVYSEADRHSLHVEQANHAVLIGPATSAQSYLSVDNNIEAALTAKADAIHPGYGFLSENSQFARRCAEAGFVFIGPKPEQIEAFALKHKAREMASSLGVPILKGSALLKNE